MLISHLSQSCGQILNPLLVDSLYICQVVDERVCVPAWVFQMINFLSSSPENIIQMPLVVMKLYHLIQRDWALVDHFRLGRFASVHQPLVREQHAQTVFEILDMPVKIQASVKIFLWNHFSLFEKKYLVEVRASARAESLGRLSPLQWWRMHGQD